VNWWKERRNQHEAEEREHDARLDAATAELRELQERGDRAVQFLAARRQRNHWRESITNMIQGAH
jgi:hypothetical protein